MQLMKSFNAVLVLTGYGSSSQYKDLGPGPGAVLCDCTVQVLVCSDSARVVDYSMLELGWSLPSLCCSVRPSEAASECSS